MFKQTYHMSTHMQEMYYAETFIVSAPVKEYTIKPHGKSAGQKYVTIKVSVRLKKGTI